MILSGVYVLACLLLIVVVLLQQGKGGDIAAAFGGSGSQAAFGARAGATLLTRATTVLGTLFMVGAMVLAIMGQRGPGSVLSGLGEPAAPVENAAPVEPAAPAADEPGEGGDATDESR
jgi:preprotein translocase subunit SecG